MDPLLQLLKKNAHTPREELARELETTESELTKRIERLEKEHVIVAYQAVIDFEKAGNGDVTALIEVKITPERGGGFDRLASRIARFDQVQSCWLMSGGYDLLVVVEGANLQEIAKFVAEKLSTIKGVLSTATHFRLKSYKENGVLLHHEPRQERLAVAP
jgi:DNA-binding Lrp family transcriptional regulator